MDWGVGGLWGLGVGGLGTRGVVEGASGRFRGR